MPQQLDLFSGPNPPKSTNKVVKVISGGQTGVDEMGLEVAKQMGIETGGTMPKGFKQEYFHKPEMANLYDMKEITDAQSESYRKRTGKSDPYTARTELNVMDSDGTVYFCTDRDSQGRIATERAAKAHHKPFLLNPDTESLVRWLGYHNIQVLNVAGNRMSRLTKAELEDFTKRLTDALVMYNFMQVQVHSTFSKHYNAAVSIVHSEHFD